MIFESLDCQKTELGPGNTSYKLGATRSTEDSAKNSIIEDVGYRT